MAGGGDNAKRLGLIAGGGDLPARVIVGAKAQGYGVFIAALSGQTTPDAHGEEGCVISISELGALFKILKKQGCTHVCFAGMAARPDFKTIKPSLASMKYLPGILKAAAKGDDALLKHIVSLFENAGYSVLAPQDLCAEALIEAGALGRVDLVAPHIADAKKARDIAGEIGGLDIGQGAIVANGLVLAVEAQEGTDAMLARIAELDENLRGTPSARAGVLAKRLKPGQEDRVDLPTIGVKTIELAAAAGLAGIMLDAGAAFVMDSEAVIARADALDLFVYGYDEGGGW